MVKIFVECSNISALPSRNSIVSYATPGLRVCGGGEDWEGGEDRWEGRWGRREGELK